MVRPEAAQTGATAVLLDFVELLDRAGGDDELAMEILSDLLTGAPRDAEALAAAVVAPDLSQVAHRAHRFRGALLSVAAHRAADAAANLELAASTDRAAVAELAAAFGIALRDTLREVERVVDTRGGRDVGDTTVEGWQK